MPKMVSAGSSIYSVVLVVLEWWRQASACTAIDIHGDRMTEGGGAEAWLVVLQTVLADFVNFDRQASAASIQPEVLSKTLSMHNLPAPHRPQHMLPHAHLLAPSTSVIGLSYHKDSANRT